MEYVGESIWQGLGEEVRGIKSVIEGLELHRATVSVSATLALAAVAWCIAGAHFYE